MICVVYIYEQIADHFPGYYYLLDHRLAWLVVIEIMCLCEIPGKTSILLGVLHLNGRIQSTLVNLENQSLNLLRRSFAFSFCWTDGI